MIKHFLAGAFVLMLLLLPTFALPGSATDTVSGKWVGHAAAGATLIDNLWEIERKGDTVSGTISLKFQSDTQWSRYAFAGQISNGVLSFEGTKWLEKIQNFCLAAGRLSIGHKAGSNTLVGEWGSNQVTGGCPIGANGSLTMTQIEVIAPAAPQVLETDSRPSPNDLVRFDTLIAAFFQLTPDTNFSALKSLQFVFENENPATLLAAGSAYLTSASAEQDKMRASVLLGAAHSLSTIRTFSAAPKHWPRYPDRLVAPLGQAAHETALAYLDQLGGKLDAPEVKVFLEIAAHVGNQNARLQLAEIFQSRRMDESRTLDQRIVAVTQEAEQYRIAAGCNSENISRNIIPWSTTLCGTAKAEHDASQKIYLGLIETRDLAAESKAKPVVDAGQAIIANEQQAVEPEQPAMESERPIQGGEQVTMATPSQPITINGRPAVFVTDKFLYKVYTIENPCIETARRKLDFRLEFRDPALARDPEIIAQAVRQGAFWLQRWPSEYTCIAADNFVGNAISYYDGNLMYRAKVHVTSNLRETKILSGERLGKLVRGTPFSLIIRALGNQEYGGYGSGKEFRFDDLLNDLDSAELKEEEKPGRDFIAGFLTAQFAKTMTGDARNRLNSASLGGSEGATSRLLSASGVEEAIHKIRYRTNSSVTDITPQEKATFEANADLISRALMQRVGSMMLLESELTRFGLTSDAEGPSKSKAPSADSQVLPFVKEKFVAGKFCGGIRSYNESIWSDSQVGTYFRTASGCGIKLFTGANATYTFVDLTNDGCSGSVSCQFSTRIVCVWQGLVMAEACEGFEGRGREVLGTVYFRDGMADRYTIN